MYDLYANNPLNISNWGTYPSWGTEPSFTLYTFQEHLFRYNVYTGETHRYDYRHERWVLVKEPTHDNDE